jgi:hypothetical protein
MTIRGVDRSTVWSERRAARRALLAPEQLGPRRSGAGAGGRLLASLGLALTAIAAHAAGEARQAITLTRGETATAAGAPTVRLALSPEIAPSWREANVGFLALRSADAQRRLDASAAGAELEVPLPVSGCALLIGDLGRPEDRGHADSWRRSRHSVKAVLCDRDADLRARRRAGALLMARAGTRDEVRLLANPATARPGSDLPVRLYADGRKAAGVEVIAEGPGGLRNVARSDGEGFAVLALPAAGPWRVHFRAGGDRAAELHFTVPEESLHETGSAGGW